MIRENKKETTIVYWVHIGIMEKKRNTTIVASSICSVPSLPTNNQQSDFRERAQQAQAEQAWGSFAKKMAGVVIRKVISTGKKAPATENAEAAAGRLQGELGCASCAEKMPARAA